MERALKSSFSMPEVVAQQAFFDDLWRVGNTTQTADDVFVDNLLDFSDAPVEEEEQQADKTIVSPNKDKPTLVFTSQPVNNCSVNAVTTAAGGTEGDLCFPADDVADLEWLSHFVEDSSSGYSLTVPPTKLSVKPDANQSNPEIPGPKKPIFTSHVQTKARSKRTRTGVRVWSLGSHSLTDSSTSSSSSSSNMSLSTPTLLWPVYNELTQSAESFGKPPKKKQATDIPGVTTQPRRCSHCLVQKTPQWRTGPLGAKTLCNACGVRYKSGRLLPEYRPACSPTFSSQIHSNNHRKVLEMRRKKEGEDGALVRV